MLQVLLHPKVIFSIRKILRKSMIEPQSEKAHKPGLTCGALGTRIPLLPSGPDGVHGTAVAQDPGL